MSKTPAPFIVITIDELTPSKANFGPVGHGTYAQTFPAVGHGRKAHSIAATQTPINTFTAYAHALVAFHTADRAYHVAVEAYDAVRDSADRGIALAARRDRYRATVRMQELCEVAEDAREALYGRGQEHTA